ncbi:OLC1v1005508C1 [Oldenlandia corymbosa var. corymbosa]|uniref:OLC1v1005508C1 n=1 Tax=Oldenlandia corymbosa var. corymbosa TaxID=529605 RepID=A0AAV1DF04_OLDCO|nr:OLC1v1005508C1 [Oldenlandia corymbosa var. corymbosa]
MNSSRRCAGCKYLRRRCPSDCILSPYFPPNNPQRFYYVHKIYGTSNVAKMLQQVPVHLRAEAANAMYYEAYCRIKDPVYGCVGIITSLNHQICEAQREISKIQAEIAVLSSVDAQISGFPNEQVGLVGIDVAPSNYLDNSLAGIGIGNVPFSSTYDPFASPFY